MSLTVMPDNFSAKPVDIRRNEPRLPSELQREIFELAAQNGASCRRLSDVAPHVKEWVEPLYYENGIVHSQHWSSKRIYSPDPAKIRYVKSLTIRCHAAPSLVHEYLSTCYNLEELNIWEPRAISQDTLPLLESLFQSPLRRTAWSSLHTLRASLRVLFQGHLLQEEDGNTHVDFTNPVVKHLRCLVILRDTEWSHPSSWVEGNNFGCLSLLRHLKFDNPDVEVCIEVVTGILRECDSLELIAFYVHDSRWWEERLPKTRPGQTRSMRANWGCGGSTKSGRNSGAEEEDRVFMIPKTWNEWKTNDWSWLTLGLLILESRRSGRAKREERSQARNLKVEELEELGLDLLYN